MICGINNPFRIPADEQELVATAEFFFRKFTFKYARERLFKAFPTRVAVKFAQSTSNLR